MKPYALFFLGAALLLGCREDDDLPIICPTSNSIVNNNLTSFLQRNAAPQQVFSFNLAQAQTLRTSAGASIRFGANAFVLPSGTAATGQAELRVRELYRVPDMLLADLPTGDFNSFLGNGITANGLRSGGEFKLQAWQGSVRLKMRAADTLRLSSPTPDSIRFGMTTWGLRLPSQTWTNTNLSVTVASATPIGNIPGQFFYQSRLPLDTLSWWNVDQLWNTNPTASRTEAQFAFRGGATATTATRVWLVPTGVNALFAPHVGTVSPDGTSYVITLPNVPIGSRLTAVVLQSQADGLYFGTQNAATQLGQMPQLTLTKLSETEILQRIRQL